VSIFFRAALQAVAAARRGRGTLGVMTVVRFSTAGESHGPQVTTLLEGIPAGLGLARADVDRELARRQRGYGRGGRMKIEHDVVRFVGGVRGGETLGGPIAMVVDNRDHAAWAERMSDEPFASAPEPVLRPRPGHADLAGSLKYDRRDARDVLERASARETAGRVAAGAVCKVLLAALGARLGSRVLSIGEVMAPPEGATDGEALLEACAAADESDVRVADPLLAERMREAILAASHRGDTLGGVFELVCVGLPPGLGSHVQWDRKLDGRIAQAIMSIQAIKGVELGLGFEAARRPGSLVHDAIGYDERARAFTRPTNGAGGLEGGMTNGMPLVVRAAMKPIATLKHALPSVDLRTKERLPAAFERSDACAVPAAAVVGEAMLAIVLAGAFLEKLGGDSLREVRRNLEGYREQLRAF
jgi:chorismate synthase